MILARTGAPSSRARSSSMSTTAEPASFMPEALPAVTVPPSFLKTVGSLPMPAASMPWRMCSSWRKSTVSRLTFTGTPTICSSKRPSFWAFEARSWERTAKASWRSRVMPCFSARFSAVTPMRISWNGSVRPPMTGSTILLGPIFAPQRASGSQYGPRLIDSAPPASATRASPVWICCVAETIACTPVPQRRLTVKAGVSVGTPAFTPTTRAMYMSLASEWMTLPKTTLSTSSGFVCARSSASTAAMRPSSVGGTSLRDLP